jgi:hypothetical protein
MTMQEALKTAIPASGLTPWGFAKATGHVVQAATVSRFMAGIHVLRLDKADALAAVLGIRILLPKAKPGRKGR